MIWKSAGAQRDEVEERNRVSSFRGYLFKLRRSKNLLAPQWGKRWITIEGHFLKWYRSENDLNASGMIDLKYIRSIHKLDSGPAWTFVITCEERTLVLRCSCKAEMNNWIRALHIQADIARGGSGMMVVSDFNQIPLDFTAVRYGGPKNRKSTTSLSLEAELDMTLQKLQELEKNTNPAEVKTADFVEEDITNQVIPRLGSGNNGAVRENSAGEDNAFGLPAGVRPSRDGREISLRGSRENSILGGAMKASKDTSVNDGPKAERAVQTKTTRYASPRGRSTSPRATRSEDLEDSTESLGDVPVRVPRSHSKPGSMSQPPTPSQSTSNRLLSRVESDNSIENISLDTKKNLRVKAIQQERNAVNNKRNPRNDTNVNSFAHQPISPNEEIVVDEFDISDSSPAVSGPTNRAQVASDFDLRTESIDDSPIQTNVVRALSYGRHQPPAAELAIDNARPPRQAAMKPQKSLRSAWDSA